MQSANLRNTFVRNLYFQFVLLGGQFKDAAIDDVANMLHICDETEERKYLVAVFFAQLFLGGSGNMNFDRAEQVINKFVQTLE